MRLMRILHTADWHLGARFHDQDRGEDEQHALDQVVRMTRDEDVDAVLVAGDVFDTANPGAAEQQRYYQTLARLVDETDVGTVVVTAGNHDSGRRIEGPRELLENLRIHVVGRLGRDTDPATCVVPLNDRQGRTRAICAAVPYLRDGDLRLTIRGESSTEAHRRYAEALSRRYGEVRKAARRQREDLPLVVMGHCFAEGGHLGGGERPVQVGNLALVSPEDLAGEASYLALGHLHIPQSLMGHGHWRYCGSLLPTGFDETQQAREVVIADLPDEPGRARSRRIPITNYRTYRRLEGDAEDVRRQIEALPFPERGTPTPWCEATVDLLGPRPGFAQELVLVARERGWRLISVRRRDQRPKAQREADTQPAPSLQELEPEDVFERCHIASWGEPPDAELLAEFRQLLDEVMGSTS